MWMIGYLLYSTPDWLMVHLYHPTCKPTTLHIYWTFLQPISWPHTSHHPEQQTDKIPAFWLLENIFWWRLAVPCNRHPKWNLGLLRSVLRDYFGLENNRLFHNEEQVLERKTECQLNLTEAAGKLFYSIKSVSCTNVRLRYAKSQERGSYTSRDGNPLPTKVKKKHTIVLYLMVNWFY